MKDLYNNEFTLKPAETSILLDSLQTFEFQRRSYNTKENDHA